MRATFGKPDSGAAKTGVRLRKPQSIGRHLPHSLAVTFIVCTLPPALPVRPRVPGGSPPGGDREQDASYRK